MAKKHTPKALFLTVSIALIVICSLWAAGCLTPESENRQVSVNIGNSDDELLNVILPREIPSQTKAYEGFFVSFNEQNKTPNYVSWELLGSETDGEASRKDEKFWQDTSISGCPNTSDYTRSGYDRGHMYPAGDAKWSSESMRQCFSMANMTPQEHSLNAGAWKTLEEKERIWAKRDGSLIIVAGPIYQPEDDKTIGEANVRVPSAFFKVILAPKADNPRAIGFVYPNSHCPGNMKNYSCSVDYVEQLTGYDFFLALPDDIENTLEANYSFNDWNRR